MPGGMFYTRSVDPPSVVGRYGAVVMCCDVVLAAVITATTSTPPDPSSPTSSPDQTACLCILRYPVRSDGRMCRMPDSRHTV